MGDGIFILILCAFTFYKKQKNLALCILIAYASSGICSQIIKHLVHAPRPKVYFETSLYLSKLYHAGRSSDSSNSFPSGHSTSAFAVATVLANFYRKKISSVLLFISALIICYSRVYLAQHFPEDVLGGAVIGVLFGTLTIIINNFYFRIKADTSKKLSNI